MTERLEYRPIRSQRKEGLTKCQKVCLCLGTATLVMSIIMLSGGYRSVINGVLKDVLQIKEGTKAYKIWEAIPVPLYMKVYIFNLTNPNEFLLGATPDLREVGPYVFREYHSKVNITTHPNFTITYMQEKTWVWDAPLSQGNELDDVLTIVNVLPVTAAFFVQNSPALLSGLSEFFSLVGEKSVIQKSANQILFEGYDDPLLKFMRETVDVKDESFSSVLKLIDMPKGISDYDRFGWFYKRNNSATFDGIYSMYTGERHLEDVGKIDLWNYKNYTNLFDGVECNKIQGSAGEIFPPGLTKTDIRFFSSDLCISMKLPFSKEITDSNGIRGYQYIGDAQSFAGSGKNCYCVKGNCAPDGTLNGQSCKMGAPAVVSFPHFLFANESLVNNVHGLKPDPKKHTFYMDLIPELGVPLGVAARMQINLQVKPYKGTLGYGTVSILEYVPEVVLPLLWFEVLTSITDDMASEIKPVAYILSSSFLPVFFSCLILVSVVVMFLSLVFPCDRTN